MEEFQKCVRCGKEVDPVRAPVVQPTEEGFVYFCSTECASGNAPKEQPTIVVENVKENEPATVVSTETGKAPVKSRRTVSGSIIAQNTRRSVDASLEWVALARDELKHSTGIGLVTLWLSGAVLASLPTHRMVSLVLILCGWAIVMVTGIRRQTGVLIVLPALALIFATADMGGRAGFLIDGSLIVLWLLVVTLLLLRWTADDAVRKRLGRSKTNSEIPWTDLFSRHVMPQGMGIEANVRVLLRASGLTDALSTLNLYRAGIVGVLMLSGLALAIDTQRPWLSAAGVCLLWPLTGLVRAWQQAHRCLRAALKRCQISGLDDRWLTLLGRVKTVVLASPRVFDSSPLSLLGVYPLEGESYEQCVAWAYGAEQQSLDHPIGKALEAHGQEREIHPDVIRRLVVERGRGIRGIAATGDTLLFGSQRLLLEHGVSIAAVETSVRQFEQEGQTVVYLAVGNRLRAMFRFGAVFESQGRAAIHKLGEMKADVILLSGDHRETAEVFAKQFDIAHVKAELTTDEKTKVVEQLAETGEIILLVGSGELDEALYAQAPLALSLERLERNAHGEDKPSGELPVTRPGSVWRLPHASLRQVCEVLYAAHQARNYRIQTLVVVIALGFLMSLFVVSGYVSVVTAGMLGLTLECYVLWTALRFYNQHKDIASDVSSV